MRFVFTALLLLFSLLQAEEVEGTFFSEFENAVGYIKTEGGNMYIVIETENGSKLIKVNKDPEQILGGNRGITKEDFETK